MLFVAKQLSYKTTRFTSKRINKREGLQSHQKFTPKFNIKSKHIVSRGGKAAEQLTRGHESSSRCINISTTYKTMKDESSTTKQTWSTGPSDGSNSDHTGSNNNSKNQKILRRRSTNLTLTSGFYSDSSGDSEGVTNIWTRLLSRSNSKAGNTNGADVDDDDSINSFGALGGYDDEELHRRPVISSGCAEATSTFKVSAAAMLSTLRHHP